MSAFFGRKENTIVKNVEKTDKVIKQIDKRKYVSDKQNIA